MTQGVKGVYKFFVNFGRMGSLEGVFVEDSIRVAAVQGTKVYFGEVLGKHSDVSVKIEPQHITLVSEDPKVVALIQENNLESGHNPFAHIYDDEDNQYDTFHRRVRALRAGE